MARIGVLAVAAAVAAAAYAHVQGPDHPSAGPSVPSAERHVPFRLIRHL